MYNTVGQRHCVTRVCQRQRIVVRTYLSSAFIFSHQFAFRPSGSTSADIISLLRTVTDFFAIQTICRRHFFELFPRHLTPSDPHAAVQVGCSRSGRLFWQSLAPYRVQRTSFAYKKHHASIIKGSGVGPAAAYTVITGYRRQLNADNTFITFADDTPAAKVTTRTAVIDSDVAWATENNLTNHSLRKSSSTITCEESYTRPPPLPDNSRERCSALLSASVDIRQRECADVVRSASTEAPWDV